MTVYQNRHRQGKIDTPDETIRFKEARREEPRRDRLHPWTCELKPVLALQHERNRTRSALLEQRRDFHPEILLACFWK
nr:unnamed protein product [Spirometra erinaceieuropaei]